MTWTGYFILFWFLFQTVRKSLPSAAILIIIDEQTDCKLYNSVASFDFISVLQQSL